MKTFLAWSGQSATCGTANTTTGLFSMYGNVRMFSTSKARTGYCETYSNQHNNYPEAITRKEARQKCLGMSVRDYNDYMDAVEVNELDMAA